MMTGMFWRELSQPDADRRNVSHCIAHCANGDTCEAMLRYARLFRTARTGSSGSAKHGLSWSDQLAASLTKLSQVEHLRARWGTRDGRALTPRRTAYITGACRHRVLVELMAVVPSTMSRAMETSGAQRPC
jgi:hypothetical protein